MITPAASAKPATAAMPATAAISAAAGAPAVSDATPTTSAAPPLASVCTATLAGKTVLIIGAASGLGASLARTLGESGATVVGDPDDVADAIRSVLLLPPSSVVAELTIMPLRETSWP